MFKRFSYDPLLDSERSIAVTIMFSIFLFLNTVVLYNLIVSIVVSFNKKMKALSQMKLDTGRAIMVVELETAIPRRFLKKLEKPYIHFLRLLPPEDIDLDRLWLNVGYSEEIQESLKEAMTRRLHRAENEIMSEIEVSCKSNILLIQCCFYCLEFVQSDQGVSSIHKKWMNTRFCTLETLWFMKGYLKGISFS